MDSALAPDELRFGVRSSVFQKTPGGVSGLSPDQRTALEARERLAVIDTARLLADGTHDLICPGLGHESLLVPADVASAFREQRIRAALELDALAQRYSEQRAASPALYPSFEDTVFIAGPASRDFAEAVMARLGVKPGHADFRIFSDGENAPSLFEDVRHRNAVLIQGTHYPVDENLMTLVKTCDALRRSQAENVTVVMPYFGYSRQDRRADKPKDGRQPISAKVAADIIEQIGKVNHLLTLDLHSPQIGGFFSGSVPVDNFLGAAVLASYAQANFSITPQTKIVSADVGSVKIMENYIELLGLPESSKVIISKRRKQANVVDQRSITVIGDVAGCDCIMVDDMSDTSGTIAKGAAALIEAGARSVRALMTFPVLSGDAYNTLLNSALEDIVFTNAIPMAWPIKAFHPASKFHVVRADGIFAEALRRAALTRGNGVEAAETSVTALKTRLFPYEGGLAGSGVSVS